MIPEFFGEENVVSFWVAWLSRDFFWYFTVKLTKPWTPELFMECYCVARNKPIRRKITKQQTEMVISLWFWGLRGCPELYCDWPVHNQHSWNFSGVHGFLSLTVNNLKIHGVPGYPRRVVLQVKNNQSCFAAVGFFGGLIFDRGIF